MKTSYRLISLAIALSLFIVMAMPASVIPQQKTAAPAAATGPKASLPVLITSCGQSPGPDQFKIFLGRLKLDFLYKENATPADLNAKSPAGAPIKTVIIVTGASLKGMGAAGVSVDDEISRIKSLIAAAKKLNIKIVGAHVEGMKRRAQGADPGDNSDEQTIDAVCPFASLLVVKKEGDGDGRFTTISKSKGIPMITYDKNMELENVLKNLFGK